MHYEIALQIVRRGEKRNDCEGVHYEIALQIVRRGEKRNDCEGALQMKRSANLIKLLLPPTKIKGRKIKPSLLFIWKKKNETEDQLQSESLSTIKFKWNKEERESSHKESHGAEGSPILLRSRLIYRMKAKKALRRRRSCLLLISVLTQP